MTNRGLKELVKCKLEKSPKYVEIGDWNSIMIHSDNPVTRKYLDTD